MRPAYASKKRGGSLSERFWRNVNRSGPGDCWEWTASCDGSGYGRFYFEGRMGGKWKGAHRASWELAHGQIPDGMRVLHRCDNPPCCNPAHLFLGTQQDNVDDMVAKGRHVARVGEAHGRARLTEADVRAIREAHAAGQSYKRLAKAYGVGDATVWHLVKGHTWRHVS